MAITLSEFIKLKWVKQAYALKIWMKLLVSEITAFLLERTLEFW